MEVEPCNDMVYEALHLLHRTHHSLSALIRTADPDVMKLSCGDTFLREEEPPLLTELLTLIYEEFRIYI